MEQTLSACYKLIRQCTTLVKLSPESDRGSKKMVNLHLPCGEENHELAKMEEKKKYK